MYIAKATNLIMLCYNLLKVDKFRVVLKNEKPDYINASYVKVSEYNYKLHSDIEFIFNEHRDTSKTKHLLWCNLLWRTLLETFGE